MNTRTDGRKNTSLLDSLNTPVGNSKFRARFIRDVLNKYLEPEDFFKLSFGRNGLSVMVNIYPDGEYLLDCIPNQFQYKGVNFNVNKSVIERSYGS